jgi:hypothetical protein
MIKDALSILSKRVLEVIRSKKATRVHTHVGVEEPERPNRSVLDVAFTLSDQGIKRAVTERDPLPDRLWKPGERLLDDFVIEGLLGSGGFFQTRDDMTRPRPAHIQAQPEVEGKGERAKASREGLAINRSDNYLVRWPSMAVQASSASESVPKGEPPTLMAHLF